MKKLFLILAFLSLNAHAADWALFDTTDELEVLVDLDSIAKDGPFKKGWFMYNFRNPQTRKTNLSSFQSILTLEYVSCGNKRAGISRVLFFPKQNGAGKPDSASVGISDIYFEDVVPGSGGEAQLDLLCAYEGTSPVSDSYDKIIMPAKATERKESI